MNKKNSQAFGANLSRLRKKKGLTIRDCAKQIGVAESTLRDWEQGRSIDDLDEITKNIRSFKENLRLTVGQKGGIKHLAETTGIPQPSLSRFFSSNTMPRRATLLKIAKALQLSQIQIVTEWAR